jgi:putative RNA 2'-phosphotransferase
MNPELVALSKRLSWLLRHGANEAELAMDEAGWSELDDVLRVLAVNRAELDLAVRQNDKGRLVVAGSRVRACQGHSLDGMPVTKEALEASWEVFYPESPLWHGTRVAAIEGIAGQGIMAGQRTHVHLAAGADSHVGKRGYVDFLIEVSPARLSEAGIGIFLAPNGVVLARRVPAEAITGLRATSKAGRQGEHHALGLLGLVPGSEGAGSE